MSKADALACFVNRRRRPHTFIVAPTMLDRLEHRADARASVRVNQSGNPTHLLT
jgi:hypothetical protein